MASYFLCMLCVVNINFILVEFWVRIGDKDPRLLNVYDDDTVRDLCKRNKLDPCVVEFDGEELLGDTPVSSLQTLYDRCLKVTKLIVYYEYNGYKDTWRFSENHKVSDLFTVLNPGTLVHLVAYDTTNTIIRDNHLLIDITTSRTQRIKITPFYCRFVVEDRSPVQRLCNPKDLVIQASIIEKYIQECGEDCFVLYHNGKRLGKPWLLLMDLQHFC